MVRTVDLEKCVGCGACFKACAFDVYRLDTCQEKTSACRPACPAGTDIRAYMSALQLSNHARAAMTLLERNALPLLTSRICQHYCEKTCTCKAVDAPINIPALENYLGTWALDHELPLPPVRRAGMAPARPALLRPGSCGYAALLWRFMKRKARRAVACVNRLRPNCWQGNSTFSRRMTSPSASVQLWATGVI